MIPIAALVLLAIQAPPSTAESRAFVQWRALEQSVVKELLSEDLDTLLATTPAPDDAQALLRYLNLAVRAGRRSAAARIIDRLGAVPLETALAERAVGFLFEHRELDLMARLIQRAPGTGRGFASNLIGYWLGRRTPEEIDRWLADRGWTQERVSLAALTKTDGALVEQTFAALRAGRCTHAAIQEVLGVASRASETPDLVWIADWCRPALATENYTLAMALIRQAPQAAALLLQRALDLPFTVEDRTRLTRLLPAPPRRTDDEWETAFKADVRKALADAERQPVRGAAFVPRNANNTGSPSAPNLIDGRTAAPQPRVTPQPNTPATTEEFNAALSRGDWRAAERVWTQLRAAMTTDEAYRFVAASIPRHIVRIAFTAAKAGHVDEAVRLWAAASNVDRAEVAVHLQMVEDKRFRTALVAFYEEMARRDPDSSVPLEALTLLGAR